MSNGEMRDPGVMRAVWVEGVGLFSKYAEVLLTP